MSPNLLLFVSSLVLFIQGQEPDDALPRDQRTLVAELTERGMPELVEELLAGAPVMHRVHVARAYAEAGGKSNDAAIRQRFLEKASDEYQRVVALGKDRTWFKGLRRRYDVALWQVEWADMILRYQSAPDLDRYDATSGLDFDRPRLIGLLRNAHNIYSEAGGRIDELMIGLRTQEQQYLLLGLADKITRLADQRRLNAAWADLYLARIDDENPKRRNLLDAALADFDAGTRSAKDTERKYNALVGAGVALRESGRNAEAMSAFDRVRMSTASPVLVVRARFEQARALLAAKRFDEARRELAELARMRADGPDDPAGFYLQLAPVMAAYSDLLESKEPSRSASRQASLRDSAVKALNEMAKRGGAWTEITQPYLAVVQGSQRKLADMSDAELSLSATKSMKDGNYKSAVEPLKLLLSRTSTKSVRIETAFNLAVCQFQLGDLRAAAGDFEAVARDSTSGDLSERAAGYAYRCRRQIAASEKTAADYERLAQSAARLADRFSKNESADEARWVAALAYQEAGQLSTAVDAYAKIPSSSPHHRSALRGMAVCRQRLYEQLPPDVVPDRRRKAARSAVDAWKEVAAQPVNVKLDKDRSIREEASLAAATLLVGEDLAQCDEALSLLSSIPQTDPVVVLRLRCLRAGGDEKSALEEFDRLLKAATASQRVRILSALAAQLETDARRLQAAGRSEEASKISAQAVGVLRDLADALGNESDAGDRRAAVRSSLAQALASSGDFQAARAEYERLVVEDPTNGDYLRKAALLEEEILKQTSPPTDSAARAESYWAKLLEDDGLREQSPSVYWEARYHWLVHQLGRGRAEEVWRGIEAEKAWYPDLGGPPWQGRLIDLAQKARAAGGQPSQP